MDKSLLVRIFVPTTEGEPGRVGECATGYPVANDLILTCRHAVRPNKRDERFPIEVRWHYHPDPTKRDWHALDADPIAWEKEDLDAVLLRCTRPEGLRGSSRVSPTGPRTGDRWESAGFPAVAKYDDVQHEEPFRGAAHSMAEAGSHFAVDVDTAPSKAKDWSGASGMPICLEGTNVILGILQQVPEGWDGKRAHATAGAKLLKCPRFRELTKDNDEERRCAKFAKDLAAILEKSQFAVEVIREKSGLCDGMDPSAEVVAERLASIMHPKALAEGMRGAYNAVQKHRETKDSDLLRSAQAVLVEAVQWLVPFQSDSRLIVELRPQLEYPNGLIAEIPCALEMVAEIYMAALEERRTLYLLRRGEGDYPRGIKNRPAPPIPGINENSAKLDSIRNDLSGKFLIGRWPNMRNEIDDIMIESLARTPGGPPMTRKESIQAAAIVLDALSRGRGGRYYLTCRLPADERARAELEAGLKALSADYKSLVILKLTGTGASSIMERQTYGDLNQMLPKES